MSAASADTVAPLKGLKVLVVEDEAIVSFLLEDTMFRLGCRDVALAGRLSTALAQLDQGLPDLAVLDVNLGNESSFPIADRLIALGVPIVFATCYGKNIDFPERFANVPVVSKPYTDESLAPKVAEALARADEAKT